MSRRRHIMEPHPERQISWAEALRLVACVAVVVYVLALYTHP